MRTVSIPDEACDFRHTKARGPGGQHVNKSSTAIELRVTISKLGLSPSVRTRLKKLARNRINQADELVIYADEHRSQIRNKEAALDRLRSLVEKALQAPKRRIPTRPGKAAKQKRLDTKKQRGATKAARRKPQL